MITEVADLIPAGIPAASYKQFQDVKCWLAWLLKYCLAERPYLKTQKGRQAVEDYRQTVSPSIILDNIKEWHTYLVMYIVMFHQADWIDIDFSVFPKMPDYILLGLMKHNFFEGQDIDTICKSFRLLSKERKLLKECAMRFTA